MIQPVIPWQERSAEQIARAYKEGGYCPFGDAPVEYMTGAELARKGITDALVELVEACPDADGRGLLARMIAERVVWECLRAEGKDLVALTKLILEYTVGLPAPRERRQAQGEYQRGLVLTQRGETWESE